MDIDSNTVPLEDIPLLLLYGSRMAEFKSSTELKLFSECCGSRVSKGKNNPLGGVHLEATIFTQPVITNPNKTDHIIIVDETMELLIDWNDQ